MKSKVVHEDEQQRIVEETHRDGSTGVRVEHKPGSPAHAEAERVEQLQKARARHAKGKTAADRTLVLLIDQALDGRI